ncbi:DUF177 domain-containing protein [Phenylobacterium aquaticum]|uniref:YceD family protein n=1 Tax=Phenylobacterium aquaticum TaxID=1763816 RepID=UPI0026EAFC36|nr:DUF177 domain-containing protein [Phenylobacterium aquaticum]
MTWTHPIRLADLARGPISLKLDADEPTRLALAKSLDLVSLPAFSCDITIKPWLDGAEIDGRLHAVVEQICGVTLDQFEQPLETRFELRVVPAGSPHTPSESEGGEIELDPEAPDPPDVLEGDIIDIAAYAQEQLALSVDPFPRKPGVTFDYTPETQEESPFAALLKLKGSEG